MKKKIIPAALTLAMVLAVCITGAFAAHGGFGRGSGTCLSGGQNFIDEDGDGLCDNWAGGGSGRCGNGQCFIDEDGDGVCDNWTGSGRCGNGQGFIDEDGDGLCDNCGTQCVGGGQNFLDQVGDGLCDNWSSRPMDGTGLGSGRGHHGCHN